MARGRDNTQTSSEAVMSIIGPGMTVVGNCESDGTIRIEGTVNGSVKAGKAVVIGKHRDVAGRKRGFPDGLPGSSRQGLDDILIADAME